jgi:hypothetical protein
MTFNHFVLIIFAFCLLSACASTPATSNREPPQASEQPASNIGEAKQLELTAFLNQHGTVSLRIDNHSAHNVDNILVGLRLRFSARIVSDFMYAVPEIINAGQSLTVDTEFAVPNARSIIRAEVIKEKIAP